MPRLTPVSMLRLRVLAGVVAAVAALAPLAVVSAPAAEAAAGQGGSRVIDGPDVASYQHPYGKAINWRKVARAHKDFAIVKATEGTSYRNPWFHRDYNGARQAGLVRGSYHFARPGYPITRTALAQARYFAASLGDSQVTQTLPPALDLEMTGGLGRAALVTWAQTFLLEVHRLTGRTPLIYTYPSFWTGALGDQQALSRYPLWMASYSGPADSSATLWQYTSGATVAGIRGRVDMSRFMEPTDTWSQLSDGTQSTPWPAQAPGAPVHVGATGGDAHATVTWMPGDTGSTRVQHYTVTATPLDAIDGTGDVSVQVSGTTTNATVPHLVNGTPYTFTVVATNSHGDGDTSGVTDPVTPMVPTALTLSGSTTTTYGGGVNVRVQLVRPDRGRGLAARDVLVERKDPGTQWSQVTTSTTDAGGWIRMHLGRPAQSLRLRFTYDGPKGWRNAHRVVPVVVANGVTASLSKTRVRHRHAVAMRGHITPGVAGVRVRREAYYGGRWHIAGVTTTGAHGRYAFRIVPRFRGTAYYRTMVAGFDGRSAGFSSVRRLRVH